MGIVVGVDIGGTFTDLALQDEATGAIHVAKVASTPQDQARGLLAGLHALEVALDRIALIVHGTTVATNAVLERKGAACGLIMTEGFRDVLELRRRDRPETYGLKGRFTPLVPRSRRVEVAERTEPDGTATQAPDADAVRGAAQALLAQGAEVCVLSFLNAYANPANEAFARDVVQEVWPNAYVVAATDVLPEIREFERTSTAVLNGYVQPLIDRYLSSLMATLGGAGYTRDVLLIQSNGGVMGQEQARRLSVNTILSGPAAGVNAALQLGRATGLSHLITCDVGGTSLDIAAIVEGRPTTAREISLEYGLPIRVPMLDIRTVGAGGGSIAALDRAGVLTIGPESTGAEPGPVCYGQGGTRPTVTDAQVALGRINAAAPIGTGRDWRLDREAARAVIAEQIGQPLGLDADAAAWAILQVANHKIAASLRLLTIEQGLDPRDFALVAFGGAGPLHAGALVRDLELRQALVPPWPGITSALGCLAADVRHDFVESVNARLEHLEPADLYARHTAHLAQGRDLIAREGIAVEGVSAELYADMAYEGQAHEVRTLLPAKPCGREDLLAAFERTYAAQYGLSAGNLVLSGRPVRIVTLRSAVHGLRATPTPAPPLGAPGTPLSAALLETRPVYVEGGWRDCPVYRRAALPPAALLRGPAVVEQEDATTVIEPGQQAQVDEGGNLHLSEA